MQQQAQENIENCLVCTRKQEDVTGNTGRYNQEAECSSCKDKVVVLTTEWLPWLQTS